MKHYVKLFSALSTGTLLGCSQLSLAPTLAGPAAVSGAGESVLSRVQPVERISSPVSEVNGLFIRGRSAHGAGQLALAQERYEQVLSQQPSHLGALNSIAVIYAQTERLEQAVEFFKRALELDPQASHVHNNFGYALLLSGQLAEAERELKRAQDLNPSSVQTRQNLQLLAQAKARAAALAGSAGSEPSTLASPESEPQLVTVKPHVYELRDGLAALPAPAQTAPVAGVPTQVPSAQVAAVKPVAPAPAPVSSTFLSGVRIEVSNGVGIRHLARRTAQRLAPMGIVTARLTNHQNYRQQVTEIQYGAGQKSAAEALSAKLPVAVKTVAAVALRHDTQMRLVLGHDLSGAAVAAWLESSADTEVAQIGDAGWRWS